MRKPPPNLDHPVMDPETRNFWNWILETRRGPPSWAHGFRPRSRALAQGFPGMLRYARKSPGLQVRFLATWVGIGNSVPSGCSVPGGPGCGAMLAGECRCSLAGWEVVWASDYEVTPRV